jgi:hypothetical protein
MLAHQLTFLKIRFATAQSNTKPWTSSRLVNVGAFPQFMFLSLRAMGLLLIIFDVGQLPHDSCVSVGRGNVSWICASFIQISANIWMKTGIQIHLLRRLLPSWVHQVVLPPENTWWPCESPPHLGLLCLLICNEQLDNCAHPKTADWRYCRSTMNPT